MLLAFGAGAVSAADSPPADAVYQHGYVYTVDAHDGVQHALAVRHGAIVYVGDDAGVKPLIGKSTQVIDLHGRMVMPGLVDTHTHINEPGPGGMENYRAFCRGRSLAFEEGLAHPETVLFDRPARYGAYAPQNFDLGYQGTVTARKVRPPRLRGLSACYEDAG